MRSGRCAATVSGPTGPAVSAGTRRTGDAPRSPPPADRPRRAPRCPPTGRPVACGCSWTPAAVAAGAAARVRRAGERRLHPHHRAAPARPRGGAGHRRREQPARRRHASARSSTASSGSWPARTPTPPGWRTRTPPRWSPRSAGRPRPGRRSTWCTPTCRCRAGGARGAGRRRPRRRCTRCTGTCSATPSSTPPSTAGAGCSSPGSPARRWPAVPRRCAGRRSGWCRSPSRCPPRPRWPGDERAGFALVLGRLCALKGVDTAVRACRAAGLPLVLAGPVGPYPDPASLERALADPAGAGAGPPRRRLVHRARGPAPGRRGGALGRHRGRRGEGRPAPPRAGGARPGPLARARRDGGLRGARRRDAGGRDGRGCLPSLLDDGVTGFLAADEEEFTAALDRVDELDPQACAQVARRRFAPAVMAEGYERLYAKVLARTSTGARVSGRGPGRPAVRR